MARITLKDIAIRCDVSPTLVSAVLNHRKGNISCQDSTRVRIESVAHELGYRPNVLASAMASKRIPVVALMMNVKPESFTFRNSYFGNMGSSLAWALQSHELEMLVVFYHSESEQLERFRDLHGKSLLGGVVSDLIPRHNSSFVSELRQSGVPYVLWGQPDVPALSLFTPIRLRMVPEYHRRYGTSRCYIMQELYGRFVLYPYRDTPAYYRFQEDPLPASADILGADDTMVVILGSEYLRRCKIPIAHPFLLEQQINEDMIPSGVPYALALDNEIGHVAEVSAQMISSWMKGIRPDREEPIPLKAEEDKLKIFWDGKGKQ